jgi:hypothetical protein
MNLKEQFVTSLMNQLKIEADPFTVSTINKMVSYVEDGDYSDFMMECFNAKNDFKRPLELISITAEKFKARKELVLFKDVEIKAKTLTQKVNCLFTAIEKKAQSLGTSTDYIIKNESITFETVKKKNSDVKYFLEQEVNALNSIADFQYWLYMYRHAQVHKLEHRLIQQMKDNRTLHYLTKNNSPLLQGKKEVEQDKQTIKLIEQGA